MDLFDEFCSVYCALSIGFLFEEFEVKAALLIGPFPCFLHIDY